MATEHALHTLLLLLLAPGLVTSCIPGSMALGQQLSMLQRCGSAEAEDPAAEHALILKSSAGSSASNESHLRKSPKQECMLLC